jgi:hypothetical protein
VARPAQPSGPTDDPVADWGPDLGHGIFDAPERSSSEPSGEVTGHEVTATRVPGQAAPERPVAVLAWIGATLTIAPGARRGEVPGLRAVVAAEPLALLPGGFFPVRPEAGGRDAPATEAVPPQPLIARPAPPEPAPDPATEEDVFEPAPAYSRSPPHDDPPPERAHAVAVQVRRWEELALAVLLLVLAGLSLRAC